MSFMDVLICSRASIKLAQLKLDWSKMMTFAPLFGVTHNPAKHSSISAYLQAFIAMTLVIMGRLFPSFLVSFVLALLYMFLSIAFLHNFTEVRVVDPGLLSLSWTL